MSNSVENVDAAGGGISFYCNGKITDNRVAGNSATATGGWSAGGGIQCAGYDPDFLSVDIYGNQIENNQVNATGGGDIRGFGGGLSFTYSNGIIRNNIIRNNSMQSTDDAYGGGIFINASQTTTVANNLISFNRIEGSGINVAGGGILYASQYVTGYANIYNNIIFKNEVVGGRGGGIALGYGSNDETVIINNTITDNKASGNGGGILIDDNFSVKMFNSILWGNQAANNAQIYSEAGSSFKILYSDIQGGFSGEGNIDQDPLFEPKLSDFFKI